MSLTCEGTTNLLAKVTAPFYNYNMGDRGEGRGVLLEWDNLGWEWEGGLYFKSEGMSSV